MIYLNLFIGDIIHLVGYVPSPTTERPIYSHHHNNPYNTKYKPTSPTYPNYVSSNGVSGSGGHQQSEWGHETNHLISSSFTPTKPIHHISLIDESGFEVSSDAIYNNNNDQNYGSGGSSYRPTNIYSDEPDVYKPVESNF